MNKFFRVVSQTETFAVTKQDGTTISKSIIVLQEAGSRYGDSYAAVLLGQQACERFQPSQLVFASLRFQHREHNGNFYQDVTVQDISRI